MFEAGALFTLADDVRIAFAQTLDAEGLVDRGMSISFIAALEGEEHQSVEDRLRALAQEKLGPLGYSCQVFVYDRL